VSTDAPQRKQKKKRRKSRQSEDCENADAVSSSAAGDCNSIQMELKQTQQWLLMQMQTGPVSAACSRFVVVVFCHFVFRQVETLKVISCF